MNPRRAALGAVAGALALAASLLGAAATAAVPGADPGGGGVTLRTYANMALSGAPASTKVVPTTALSLPGGVAGSAELVGTVSFPAKGAVYHFNCDWAETTMGFVWVDGHMVCQDGNVYKPGAGTTDNPLPVNVFNRTKGVVSSLPFRAHVYFGGQTPPPPPPPPPPAVCSAKGAGVFDDHNHRCGFKQVGGGMTVTWEKAAQACYNAGFTVAGAEASLGQEIWCGHTATPNCPTAKDHKPVPCPGNKSETCGDAWFLEVIEFECKPTPSPPPGPAPPSPPPPGSVVLNVTWAPMLVEQHERILARAAAEAEAAGSDHLPRGAAPDANQRGDDVGSSDPPRLLAARETANAPGDAAAEVAERLMRELQHSAIPTQALGPTLPGAEAKRDSLQRALATGWGPWLHSNMLPLVKLPDAATVSPALCSTITTHCVTSGVPDGAKPHPGNRPGTETRVGLHAFDRSYVQYYFGGGETPFMPANVSVEFSASGDGNADLDVLFTPQDGCGSGSCDHFEIQLQGRYAWLKAGGVNVTSAGAGGAVLRFEPAGLPPFSLFTTAPATLVGKGNSAVAIGLGGGAVGLSTSPNPTVAGIKTKLASARAAEEQLLVKTFGADRAGEGQAVKASAMWTLVSTPAENGPLLPVSRVWSFTPSPVNDDFTYAIFDWDNLFGTLLAACGAPNSTASSGGPWGGFEIAVSNLFQVVKSKTSAGFVPNFAAGGLRSQDRTEPPIGAKVLLNMVEKFGAERMAWVVDALFDDLTDWNDWFLRKRLKPPLNMVALGTFNDQTHQAGNMQDARYESGLDNSPMYDGTFYNDSNGCGLIEDGCGLMQLYDVGFSSMFVQEALSLIQLAPVAGRPATVVDVMTQRSKDMTQKISDHLWDDGLGIFVNRFSADHNNGTFYEHVSPTSFYALQTPAATDEQAATMATRWLMNASHFCIAPGGDFDGNSQTCYWGLPSIEASDPAFPPLGYWRGYIWGPMAQLTYWSLQNYDHVPEIRNGRKAMCKQLAALMMSQWNEHRHICENYNPHRTADTTGGDCSGTRFYHWGALTGLVGLMEDGLF